MAGKAGKVWSLPRFWVSISPYKKQPVKIFWGRIFAVAALIKVHRHDANARDVKI